MKNKIKIPHILVLVILLLHVQNTSGNNMIEKGDKGITQNTEDSIQGNKWCFNNKLINLNSYAEGLLMNVRMVNSVFEDRGTKLQEKLTDFRPMENTDA